MPNKEIKKLNKFMNTPSKSFGIAIVLLLGIATTGCTSTISPKKCPSNLSAAIQESIYFGTDRTGREPVSQKEWEQFLDTLVTPEFPDGLTVISGAGQWRGKDGINVKEHSYVLSLVHNGSQSTEESIQKIVNAYKSRFQQEAVLRVQGQACIAF